VESYALFDFKVQLLTLPVPSGYSLVCFVVYTDIAGPYRLGSIVPELLLYKPSRLPKN
jgi:hypothetical protein